MNIDWFENIGRTSRIVILTLCCAGAMVSSSSAQTQPRDSSARGFSVGGHVAIVGSNPDSFDLNGQNTIPRASPPQAVG